MRSTITSIFRRDFGLYADPDHILRVLENLSRNAAQALMAKGAEDGRPKAIRFAAIRTDGLALIELSDTGPGFPPDQAERIFEPFHKSTSQAGAGLGLAIAADLVTRNGGAITLAPAKADDFYCGARFLIKLPTPEGRRAHGGAHPARGLSLNLSPDRNRGARARRLSSGAALG